MTKLSVSEFAPGGTCALRLLRFCSSLGFARSKYFLAARDWKNLPNGAKTCGCRTTPSPAGERPSLSVLSLTVSWVGAVPTPPARIDGWPLRVSLSAAPDPLEVSSGRHTLTCCCHSGRVITHFHGCGSVGGTNYLEFEWYAPTGGLRYRKGLNWHTTHLASGAGNGLTVNLHKGLKAHSYRRAFFPCFPKFGNNWRYVSIWEIEKSREKNVEIMEKSSPIRMTLRAHFTRGFLFFPICFFLFFFLI